MITKVLLSKVNGVPTNNVYADIRYINEENFDDIIKLYNIVNDGLDGKSWLKFRDHDYLQEILNRGGFIVGCYVEGEIIASALCETPSITDIELMNEIGIPSEDFVNTYISGFVMVHPSYRGNSLQSILLNTRIQQSQIRGKKYILTTVAVENVYSLNNILNAGFKIGTTRAKEDGTIRYVLYKDISESYGVDNLREGWYTNKYETA